MAMEKGKGVVLLVGLVVPKKKADGCSLLGGRGSFKPDLPSNSRRWRRQRGGPPRRWSRSRRRQPPYCLPRGASSSSSSAGHRRPRPLPRAPRPLPRTRLKWPTDQGKAGGRMVCPLGQEDAGGFSLFGASPKKSMGGTLTFTPNKQRLA